MLTGRAMYIWHLETALNGGSVAAFVQKAQNAKLSSLWIKIADGANKFENVVQKADLMRDAVSQCAAVGIQVLGYHVPWCATGDDATNEVQVVSQTVHDFSLGGVVVDNEEGAAYFKGDAGTARTYGSGLRTEMRASGKIVLMSSHDVISGHPGAYATVIGQYIDINAPQVYYGQSPSVQTRLTRADNENRVIHAPFFPVGAAFLRRPTDNDGGFLDPEACGAAAAEFIQLVSDLRRGNSARYPGYGFWNWEEAPQQVWDVLTSTEVFVPPRNQAAVG